jgi:putative glutamine amidotransferase
VSRPRIGITGVERSWDGAARVGVNALYVQAVLAAGGLPVLLPPVLAPADAVELFDDCDGLLLTGGEDIDPALYGAKPHPKLGTIDRRRDDNELALIEAARARERPTLGICRGIQILNVAFGGTLWQDLPSERPGPIDHDPHGPRDVRSHPVDIRAGCRIAAIVGSGRHEVNSLHHQGLDRIGKGLVVVATSPDGLVEGVESADPEEWLIGVEWHPEELVRDPDAADLKLFTEFISAARTR